MRLSVMGLADDEEGACPAGTVPASPGSFSLAEAQLDTETVHHCAVEAQGALEIADADKNMGEHLGSFGSLEDGGQRRWTRVP
jgi:hypothetical protein